jgi:hypothetical protein
MASPLSVRSTLWTGWPPTISQPFCAARVMALLSISSSFTLMTWESVATDAHCDRLPSMTVCAALQRRTARGSYEREGARETDMPDYSKGLQPRDSGRSAGRKPLGDWRPSTPDTLPTGIDCSNCWRTASSASSFIGRPRIALQSNHAGPSTHCGSGTCSEG